MDVLEPQAIDQGAVEKALLVFRNLPPQKRERVAKMLELLETAESAEEGQEIAKAITEVLAKAAGHMPPGGQVIDLEHGVSDRAKATVRGYYRNIGNAIRTHREKMGLTQKQLAEASGLPQSHISRLEAGLHAPTQITIRKIAEGLNVDPGQIDILYD